MLNSVTAQNVKDGTPQIIQYMAFTDIQYVNTKEGPLTICDVIVSIG